MNGLLSTNSFKLQVWVQTRAYLKGTLGNKCVVLVLLQFKNYGRSSNKSWTRYSRVFRQLWCSGAFHNASSLTSSCLIYLLSLVTHEKCKKINAPEAATSFQQGTASLLSAGGRSERQGTKTYKSLSKSSLQPLGRLQQAGQERGQTSSSQHICLHLCLSEEKLNYLTLENKGEKKKEPVSISLLNGGPEIRGAAFALISWRQSRETFALHPRPVTGAASVLASKGLWNVNRFQHITCSTVIPNAHVSTPRGSPALQYCWQAPTASVLYAHTQGQCKATSLPVHSYSFCTFTLRSGTRFIA